MNSLKQFMQESTGFGLEPLPDQVTPKRIAQESDCKGCAYCSLVAIQQHCEACPNARSIRK